MLIDNRISSTWALQVFQVTGIQVMLVKIKTIGNEIDDYRIYRLGNSNYLDIDVSNYPNNYLSHLINLTQLLP
jgi:hypothetical protein